MTWSRGRENAGETEKAPTVSKCCPTTLRYSRERLRESHGDVGNDKDNFDRRVPGPA